MARVLEIQATHIMPKVMANKEKPPSPIIMSTAQDRKNFFSYILKWHAVLQIFLSQSSYLVPEHQVGEICKEEL